MTELRKVVATTTLEVRTPSCPMFFAIIKQLTVVGDPSIIRRATSLSVWNPMPMAKGRKTAGSSNNFIKEHRSVGLTSASAFLPSNPAPRPMRARGVAKTAMFFMVF